MKYLTTQVNLYDGKMHLEPIYMPASSLGENIYLRVIVGNFKPTTMSFLIEGSAWGKTQALVENIPTVWEAPLTQGLFKDFGTDYHKSYKIRLFINLDNKEYEVETEQILQILGVSFGIESETEVSELFHKLNKIKDELKKN